jgi:hypothetical protein
MDPVMFFPFFRSALGVLIAAIAYHNRNKPDWQRDMPKLMIRAVVRGARCGDVSAPPRNETLRLERLPSGRFVRNLSS